MFLGRKFALDISSRNFNIMKIEQCLDSGVDLVFVSSLRKLQFDLLANMISNKFRDAAGYRDQLLILLEVPVHMLGPIKAHDDEGCGTGIDEYLAGATSSFGVNGFDGIIVDMATAGQYEASYAHAMVLEEILSRACLLSTSNHRLKAVCLKNANIHDVHKARLADSDIRLIVHAPQKDDALRRLCEESHIALFEDCAGVGVVSDEIGYEAPINNEQDLKVNVLDVMPPKDESTRARDEFSLRIEIPDTYSFEHRAYRYCDPLVFSRIEKCLQEGPGYFVIKDVFTDRLEEIRQTTVKYDGTRWEALACQPGRLNDFRFLSELVCKPEIIAVTEHILGWDCLVDNMAFTVSYPGAGTFGPHIDSPFDRNPGCRLPPTSYIMSLQCIYCLDEFTRENGTFFIVPGSQSAGMHLTEMNRRRYGQDLSKGKILVVEAGAGDVIVALGSAWHGALGNVTGTPRRGLLVQHVSSVVSPRDDFDLTKLADDVLKGYTLNMIDKMYRNRRNDGQRKSVVERWLALSGG